MALLALLRQADLPRGARRGDVAFLELSSPAESLTELILIIS